MSAGDLTPGRRLPDDTNIFTEAALAPGDCPSCQGPKTRRARLCARCRRGANAAGEALVLQLITPGQMRAFYFKANALDRARGQRIGTAKREALARAGVESTKQLTETAASDAIDWLAEAIAETEA